ncbi:MAG: type II secretion system protein M [Gammaproteobacteria bacterium]|nr:type II secretion system protein M [Gammaproteobacteria bacterium]
MLEQLKALLANLNERERRIVYAAGAALVVVICYQLLWSPLFGGMGKLHKKVEQQQKDIAWMQDNMGELRELSRSSARASTPGRSIYSVIELSARSKFGDAIQVQQEGQKVRVIISNASFDAIMLWLDGLQTQQQVAIREFNAETSGSSGYVKSTILLEG